MSLVEVESANPAPRSELVSHTGITRDVMRRHEIVPEAFFGPYRDKNLVQARKEAAVLLKGCGFSIGRIARILNRHRRTVRHYLDPEDRAARTLRYASKRGCMVKIAPRYARRLHELAKLTDTTIEVLVNQAISDTLETA